MPQSKVMVAMFAPQSNLPGDMNLFSYTSFTSRFALIIPPSFRVAIKQFRSTKDESLHNLIIVFRGISKLFQE